MTYAIDQLALLSFLATLVWAAVSDGARFIIPNRVCAAIVLLYPVHVLTHSQPIAWPVAVAIALVALFLGAVAFSRGWAGGGDVKLFAATSLWAGPQLMSPFLLVTAITGGLLAVGAVVVSSVEKRKSVRTEAAGGAATVSDGKSSRPLLPYGIAIAMGGAFVAVQLLRG